MKKLADRIALVTGGSRGVGLALAHALAAKKVRVALVARGDSVTSAAEEIAVGGTDAIGIQADITQPDAHGAIIEQCEQGLGPIDILVNNAGLGGVDHFARQDSLQIAAIMNTNLVGPMLLTRAVVPSMVARGHGHILNVSSISGRSGVPFMAAYSASKAGLVNWTHALRMEVKRDGVGVSVICPSPIRDTGMYKSYGRSDPRFEVTIEATCKAALRAIENDIPEIILSPGASKVILALGVFFPGFPNKLLEKMGVLDTTRQIADRAYQSDSESESVAQSESD